VRIVLKLMVTKSGVIGLSIGLIVVFTAISLAGNDKILDETSIILKMSLMIYYLKVKFLKTVLYGLMDVTHV